MNSPLLASIEERDIPSLLSCLGATEVSVPRDGFAMMAGDEPDHIGIVLEGRLQVIREDDSGSRALLSLLSPGDFYGETLACAGVVQSPVSVVAGQPSRVLKLGFRRILSTCPNSCAFHSALVGNMVAVIARKNLMLQSRMEILDKKTIRERLLLYLTNQKKQRGEKFAVPFDRSELAEYLAVDRSALSREMGRMRDEGVIRFHKNQFEVVDGVKQVFKN